LRDEIITTQSLESEKVHAIYNPVITDETYKMIREPINHPWFVNKTKPIIISAGRLTYSKGFDVLIKAFAMTRQKIDARLAILGGGEEQQTLQNIIDNLGLGEDIQLIGHTPNPFPYFYQSDLFVLASRAEGFAMVLVEAMFCGIPIVSTNCDYGPREILEGGKDGTLVDVDNEKQLSNAICRVLTDRKNNAELLRKLAEKYSDSIAVDRYSTLISNILTTA
jgi:glycosyltransferase involved in cell wall biosynthesis